MRCRLRGFGCAILVILAYATAAHANANAVSPLSTLAFDKGWLKLVHYQRDGGSPSGWRSAIHSDDFFLSAGGSVDPLLELQATLAAFQAPPPVDNPDQQAQCRFPARWLWLRARLTSHPALQSARNCPEYDSWTKSRSVSSLSIVFATGYLANPASYYGHVLLKFNFRESDGRAGLLDVSVNYGAIVEGDDGLLEYIVKSVFGGYDGGFSHIHFYFHNHNYGDNELRDLWEFRLDLSQDAVDMIVAHAWEVLGKRYHYRFFRHNCAYRIAELVQIVDELDLIPKNKPWIIPQALIQELETAQFQGRPLLAEVSYLPSRQSRFYQRYMDLSEEETQVLKEVVLGRQSFYARAFEDLSMSSKQAVLDTLLDYYQFVGNPIETAPEEVKERYTSALSTRYRLQPGSPEVTSLEPRAPHLGRPVGWLQAAWFENTATGEGLSLRFRPAYYDVLDSDSGHVRNSALIMGDTQINVHHDRIYVHRLDLIGIESAKPGLSGLPGDGGAAWRVHVGAEQQRLDCDDCLVARFQGDIGYGRLWARKLFGAIYAGGAVQSNHADQGPGFGRASTSLIMRQGDHFTARIGFEYRFPFTGSLDAYGAGELEARWSIGSRSDLRALYQRERAEALTLGLGVYW